MRPGYVVAIVIGLAGALASALVPEMSGRDRVFGIVLGGALVVLCLFLLIRDSRQPRQPQSPARPGRRTHWGSGDGGCADFSAGDSGGSGDGGGGGGGD